MNTSNYFIELLITGAGTLLAITLFSFSFWGIWIPFDQIMSDGALIGLLIVSFPLVYTVGIVTDRAVDNLYDRWFAGKIILNVFCEGEERSREINEKAFTDHGKARSKIYLKSDSLRQVFEYGRMRIRICRAWAFNSILILIGSLCMIWSLSRSILPTHSKWGLTIFLSILFIISTLVSFYAWKTLTYKECANLKRQSELIDEIL